MGVYCPGWGEQVGRGTRSPWIRLVNPPDHVTTPCFAQHKDCTRRTRTQGRAWAQSKMLPSWQPGLLLA